jgi:hypothetical protein
MVDSLRAIATIQDVTQRERLLSSDYTVRLENFEDDGSDAVVGELVRCQKTNLPAEIAASGRKALSAARLGHSVVFRLNHKKGVLGVQYDNRVVSPGRILDYLSAFNPAAIYGMAPVIDAKAWQKFNSGPTRKLSFRIANPRHMGELSGSGKAVGQGFKAMAEAYDAPSIAVEISMGHHKGALSNAIGGLASVLSSMTFPGVRVDRLQAVTLVNDASEEIDLIQERIVARDELNIDDRDPDKNWKIKRDFLCAEMKRIIG